MSHTSTATDSVNIRGITKAHVEQWEQLWEHQLRLQAVWLFGSRAIGRHQPGADIDICLEGVARSHDDLVQLIRPVDDLLPLWRVELLQRHELSAELDAHVTRVGLCICDASVVTGGTEI
jgi:predicted nucleotidyltransferase